jgi:trehalose 6-phosphate synthase
MVRAYPSSIDVDEVRAIAESQRAQDYLNRVGEFTAKHTIVRVDRAEPNKNIIRGFRAYQTMLESHPELKEEVTFLAFLVPSRTHIKQYERYMEEIEALVRQINSAHGSPNWQPVHIFSENNYTQAIAGLKLYDTLLVNPVVDGMNPVAKEGPIVNTQNGVLVISEGSSAFDQLRGGALAVAPADIEGTAQALYEAVTMSPEERAQRATTLVESIEREDSVQWLLTQFQDILSLTQ